MFQQQSVEDEEEAQRKEHHHNGSESFRELAIRCVDFLSLSSSAMGEGAPPPFLSGPPSSGTLPVPFAPEASASLLTALKAVEACRREAAAEGIGAEHCSDDGCGRGGAAAAPAAATAPAGKENVAPSTATSSSAATVAASDALLLLPSTSSFSSSPILPTNSTMNARTVSASTLPLLLTNLRLLSSARASHVLQQRYVNASIAVMASNLSCVEGALRALGGAVVADRRLPTVQNIGDMDGVCASDAVSVTAAAAALLPDLSSIVVLGGLNAIAGGTAIAAAADRLLTTAIAGTMTAIPAVDDVVAVVEAAMLRASCLLRHRERLLREEYADRGVAREEERCGGDALSPLSPPDSSVAYKTILHRLMIRIEEISEEMLLLSTDCAVADAEATPLCDATSADDDADGGNAEEEEEEELSALITSFAAAPNRRLPKQDHEQSISHSLNFLPNRDTFRALCPFLAQCIEAVVKGVLPVLSEQLRSMGRAAAAAAEGEEGATKGRSAGLGPSAEGGGVPAEDDHVLRRIRVLLGEDDTFVASASGDMEEGGTSAAADRSVNPPFSAASSSSSLLRQWRLGSISVRIVMEGVHRFGLEEEVVVQAPRHRHCHHTAAANDDSDNANGEEGEGEHHQENTEEEDGRCHYRRRLLDLVVQFHSRYSQLVTLLERVEVLTERFASNVPGGGHTQRHHPTNSSPTVTLLPCRNTFADALGLVHCYESPTTLWLAQFITVAEVEGAVRLLGG